MDLKELRNELDAIDDGLAELLARRMDVTARVAQYKAEHNLPIYDPERERQKLFAMANKVGSALAPAADALFSLLLDLSKSQQRHLIGGELPIKTEIAKAMRETEEQLPARPLIACQGTEGAFSQQAGERMFPGCGILYFSTFAGVFTAIEQGLCRYGVLPIENSTAGSVNRIYDLMMEHNFYIVRSCRVKVDHCLVANQGASLGGIREIYSHEQAIAQCGEFLKTLKDVKVTPCENTALAAKMVRESGRTDMAALSSRSCAEIYGLDCLKESVQDAGNNYTRFICISRKLEIYPGSDRTSLMMVLPHKRGSLYRVLSTFNTLGINLLKLESRPLPNSDFEFMFYFDIELSMYSEELLQLFSDLSGLTVSMKYLGTYLEEC